MKVKKKITITAIILTVAVLIAIIGGTLAMYTSQDHQRSVIRNRDADIIRFSSDKLYRVTAEETIQKYYVPMNSTDRTISFQVCNYDQSKSTLFNEKRVNYTIQFKVTNGTDDFNYSISNGTETKMVKTGNTQSLTGSLAGGQRSADNYSITFTDNEFNKVQFEVTVTPDDLTLTQNRLLKAILIPIENALVQGYYVSGEYTDSYQGTPDQFDAYNYAISVSGGAGYVKLEWDADLLDIDPFFKDKSGASGSAGEYIIPMDSNDSTAAYVIQFYNKSDTVPNWENWDDLGINVSVSE